MYGEGYAHGPVDIEIQGYGFSAEGPHGADKKAVVQSHRCGHVTCSCLVLLAGHIFYML